MRRTLPHLASAALLWLLSIPVAHASVVVPLDPLATFLHTNGEGATPAAPALRLSDLGFAPGDRVRFEVVGDFDNGPGADVFARSLGLFSSSDTLLALSELHRVPGAIASDAPAFETHTTFFGAQPTDIAEDFAFDVPDGTIVTVPAGAVFVFVAAHDQLYRDNGDPDHDFGVRLSLVTEPPVTRVPEPQTLALCAFGLAGIGRRAWRARRR